MGHTAAPANFLPPEILEEVLAHLKSTSNASLLQCLFVSRAWHQVALPIFYSTVVLGVETVSIFADRSRPRHYSLVRSLTIRITLTTQYEMTLAGTDNWNDVHAIAVARSHQLQELKHILPLMSRLVTFSLYVDPWDANGVPVKDLTSSITKRCIVQLVCALPLSCVDLEIDTKAMECYEVIGLWDDGHVCEAFAEVLLRMRHVRVRLVALCPCLISHETPRDPGGPRAQPTREFITMPHLKTFLVSAHLTNNGWQSAHSCSSRPQAGSWFNPDSANVYKALLDLAKRGDKVPPGCDIFMLWGLLRRNIVGDETWSALIRARANDDSSIATPFIAPEYAQQTDPVRWLVRLKEEQRFTSIFSEVQEIAEGRLWRNFQGGERLPAALLGNDAHDFDRHVRFCAEVPPRMMDDEEMTFLRPGAEATAGKRLMFPKILNTTHHQTIRDILTTDR